MPGLPRIAIVDDNDSVLRALDRMIRSLGMQSNTYSSAQDFLSVCEAAPESQPDCLILDVQMPGITGLELQERLAHDMRSIPIIMISAHDDKAAHDKAMQGGATAFLRKPFKDDDLISMLHKVLGQANP